MASVDVQLSWIDGEMGRATFLENDDAKETCHRFWLVHRRRPGGSALVGRAGCTNLTLSTREG